MSRKTQTIIAIISLLAAIGVAVFVYRTFASMVTTAEVITPIEPIAPGSLIEDWMLGVKEVPRPLLDEDIYLSAEELVGRVAVVPLHPGMLVYRPFAVAQEAFRLVDNPELEVVSFPVDPARAVGGQVQVGHEIDIWRLASVRPSGQISVTELAQTKWATATLLVEDAQVVDVRASTGQAVARQPGAIPGQVGSDQEQRGTRISSPLQIVTVAVPPNVAQQILGLVAEEKSGVELWIGLAPLVEAGTGTAWVSE